MLQFTASNKNVTCSHIITLWGCPAWTVWCCALWTCLHVERYFSRLITDKCQLFLRTWYGESILNFSQKRETQNKPTYRVETHYTCGQLRDNVVQRPSVVVLDLGTVVNLQVLRDTGQALRLSHNHYSRCIMSLSISLCRYTTVIVF